MIVQEYYKSSSETHLHFGIDIATSIAKERLGLVFGDNFRGRSRDCLNFLDPDAGGTNLYLGWDGDETNMLPRNRHLVLGGNTC